MRLTPKQEGNIIMFIVICVFAINIPVNKYVYSHGYLSSFGMTLMRMSFGGLAFWFTSLFTPKEKVEKKDMLILFVGGLFGMVLNQGLFAYGLSRTSTIDASIITTAGPLFAMIIAAIVLKEPVTAKKVGGVVVGAAGAIFLVYTSHLGHPGQEADMIGNLSVASASFRMPSIWL